MSNAKHKNVCFQENFIKFVHVIMTFTLNHLHNFFLVKWQAKRLCVCVFVENVNYQYTIMFYNIVQVHTFKLVEMFEDS